MVGLFLFYYLSAKLCVSFASSAFKFELAPPGSSNLVVVHLQFKRKETQSTRKVSQRGDLYSHG
jgi:hypothetical protein